MRVAVITVGDELLSGDIVNTNAAWLCERLNQRGATVERVTTVPDRVTDIARVVNEYRAEYDAVVVTGGLGPTHDDVTMDGVAAAVGRDVEPHPDARERFEDHGYAGRVEDVGELPRGARLLPNEEGVAPGAVIEGVYVLPGVPDEMKAMFDQVADEFTGTQRYTESLRTSETESELVDRLRAAQEQFDVTVGSYPGDGVRLKVTATDPDTAAEAAAWLRERVELAEE